MGYAIWDMAYRICHMGYAIWDMGYERRGKSCGFRGAKNFENLYKIWPPRASSHARKHAQCVARNSTD